MEKSKLKKLIASLIIMLIIIVALCLLIWFTTPYNSAKDTSNKDYKVVCYWSSWSYYRTGDGQFNGKHFDPNVCTHMIYAFSKLTENNTIGVFRPKLDTNQIRMYQHFNDLRKKNPKLKTMIAIGGWNEGSTKYSIMASSQSSRKTFIDSVIQFLERYKFDGLDLDWEYPGFNAIGDGIREIGNTKDKQNFISLIRELKTAFKSGGYLLSAAIAAGQDKYDNSYDVKDMSKYLDFISVMTYTFNGPWSKVTGHKAPLYQGDGDSKTKNVDYAVNYWIKKGANPNKLILGIPLNGISFLLSSINNTGFNEPVIGPGLSGRYTNKIGFMNYNEYCEIFNNTEWKITRDNVRKVPYAVFDDQWLSFDDEISIKEKVLYGKKNGLGGVMVWSLDGDDFTGSCGKGKYPLLNAINRALKEN